MIGIADRGALDWKLAGPLLFFSALCFVLAQLAFRRRTP
jgi:hypothetical protein